MAEEAVEGANSLVKFITDGVHDDVISTGIVTRLAAKRFFKFGETFPGMIGGGVIGGDTPEIEMFNSLLFGVKNCCSKKGDGGWEFFKFGISGRLHIVSGAGIIEKEAGGENLAVFWIIPCPFRL